MDDQKQHDLSTREGCFEAFLEQKRRAEESEAEVATLKATNSALVHDLSHLQDVNCKLQAAITDLKATVQRLKAPVSDEEYEVMFMALNAVNNKPGKPMRGMDVFNAIIAARATPPAKEASDGTE